MLETILIQVHTLNSEIECKSLVSRYIQEILASPIG